ncbi:MAG TPA: DUF692 domain-containing protein [Polyangiaceae bacterium]|nr:DUF692 domain-containing protein [Polyangiaceae bacterium]
MTRSPPAIRRDALGLGLRRPHYGYIFEHWPAVDFFEIISENFLGPAFLPQYHLSRVRERYPVVLHGVGLNLLGHAPLDESYLDALCRLAEASGAAYVTDHLCWTGAHGVQHHDLLPTPYTEELVEFAAERAAYVQGRLGVPFGLENLSSYVEFESSTLSEAEFYTRVVKAAGCWSMLDINNVYVSSQNHGFDPSSYLELVDFTRVLQVHLAGHTRTANGLLIDTHDHPVSNDVLALYRVAWQHGGPFPTLLEWDDQLPPMPELLGELERIREARA